MMRVNGQIDSIDLIVRKCSATTAPGIALGFDLTPSLRAGGSIGLG